jgi:hypothetical protein
LNCTARRNASPLSVVGARCCLSATLGSSPISLAQTPSVCQRQASTATVPNACTRCRRLQPHIIGRSLLLGETPHFRRNRRSFSASRVGRAFDSYLVPCRRSYQARETR